jgi:hypothetical protein
MRSQAHGPRLRVDDEQRGDEYGNHHKKVLASFVDTIIHPQIRLIMGRDQGAAEVR